MTSGVVLSILLLEWSAQETGKINISDRTYNLVKDDIECTYKGEIEVKNGLKLKTY